MCIFFLSVSFVVSVQVRIFSLNMRDIIIYVARWWEKYLSKCSLIKHTCSWRDKLIVSSSILESEYHGTNNHQKQPLEVLYKKNLFLKISQYLQENTGVFLWILRNFKKSPFWRKFANGCFQTNGSVFWCTWNLKNI